MFCSSCNEVLKELQPIGNSKFCYECIQKFSLVKCPNKYCNNVISRNGKDDERIDDYLCYICDTMYCDECLIKAGNTVTCVECFYECDDEEKTDDEG